MLEPHNTIEYLDKLKAKGLTDQQFRIVHFLPKETIERHRNYINHIKYFIPRKRNMIVCERLRFIVEHINEIKDEQTLTKLAQTAANKYPM